VLTNAYKVSTCNAECVDCFEGRNGVGYFTEPQLISKFHDQSPLVITYEMIVPSLYECPQKPDVRKEYSWDAGISFFGKLVAEDPQLYTLGTIKCMLITSGVDGWHMQCRYTQHPDEPDISKEYSSKSFSVRPGDAVMCTITYTSKSGTIAVSMKSLNTTATLAFSKPQMPPTPPSSWSVFISPGWKQSLAPPFGCRFPPITFAEPPTMGSQPFDLKPLPDEQPLTTKCIILPKS